MYTDDEVQQRLKDAAAAKGVAYDPTDAADVAHRDNSQEAIDMAMRKYDTRAGNQPNSGGQSSNPNQPPAQAWNSSAEMFPDWYHELMTRQASTQQAAQAETKSRADALYSTLDAQAKQGTAVSADDPTIRGQVDAFRAEQERARRNDISNTAEAGSPYMNIRGEQRMAAERAGQNTSGFQAQLMGREVQSHRDQIAQALAAQGGMLSGDQQRNMQSQLAMMDQAINEANAKTSATSVGNQFTLGQGQLALGGRSLDQSGDQFLRELALRQWDMGNQNDYRWATL